MLAKAFTHLKAFASLTSPLTGRSGITLRVSQWQVTAPQRRADLDRGIRIDGRRR